MTIYKIQEHLTLLQDLATLLKVWDATLHAGYEYAACKKKTIIKA